MATEEQRARFAAARAESAAKAEKQQEIRDQVSEILKGASKLERNEMLRIDLAVGWGLDITATWEEIQKKSSDEESKPADKESYEAGFRQRKENIIALKKELGLEDMDDEVAFKKALLEKAKELLEAGTPGENTDRSLPGFEYSMS